MQLDGTASIAPAAPAGPGQPNFSEPSSAQQNNSQTKENRQKGRPGDFRGQVHPRWQQGQTVTRRGRDQGASPTVEPRTSHAERTQPSPWTLISNASRLPDSPFPNEPNAGPKSFLSIRLKSKSIPSQTNLTRVPTPSSTPALTLAKRTQRPRKTSTTKRTQATPSNDPNPRNIQPNASLQPLERNEPKSPSRPRPKRTQRPRPKNPSPARATFQQRPDKSILRYHRSGGGVRTAFSHQIFPDPPPTKSRAKNGFRPPFLS